MKAGDAVDVVWSTQPGELPDPCTECGDQVWMVSEWRGADGVEYGMASCACGAAACRLSLHQTDPAEALKSLRERYGVSEASDRREAGKLAELATGMSVAELVAMVVELTENFASSASAERVWRGLGDHEEADKRTAELASIVALLDPLKDELAWRRLQYTSSGRDWPYGPQA
jgi:hypothetical protein